MMELLFSYGTLQLEKVQMESFGRTLKGAKDAIPGYKLSTVEITDKDVLEKSGLIVFDPWISYLLLIVAALLTKRFIERPGRSWIARRLQPAPASRLISQ